MSQAARTRRRWLQFSVGTMFLAVTVFALVAAWFGYHMNWIRQRHQIRAHGGPGSIVIMTFYHEYPKLPWSLRLLGESALFADQVEVPESTSDEELQRLRKLFPETYVGRNDR